MRCKKAGGENVFSPSAPSVHLPHQREARAVLRMRFGMYDGRTHTLEEVGQIFGVTRERIRQIENKAIRKLRHPSRAKRIKDFYC